MYLNFGKKNEVFGNYNKFFVLILDNISCGYFVEIEKNVSVFRRFKFNIMIFFIKILFFYYLFKMYVVSSGYFYWV